MVVPVIKAVICVTTGEVIKEAPVKVKVVDKLPPTVDPVKTVLVVAEVMVEPVVVTFVVVVLVLVTAKDPP